MAHNSKLNVCILTLKNKQEELQVLDRLFGLFPL